MCNSSTVMLAMEIAKGVVIADEAAAMEAEAEMAEQEAVQEVDLSKFFHEPKPD